MNSIKLANFISFILGPQIWFPVIFYLLLSRTDLSITYPKIIVPLIFLLQVIIPLAGPFIAFKKGKIKSLDIPERKDRVGFMLVASLSWLTSLLVIYFFGNFALFKTSLIIFVLIFIMFLITLFWKISIHVATNTAGVFFVNYVYGWHFLYLFLLIPLVAWARLKLRVHTPFQLISGFLVTACVASVYIFFFSK